MDYDDLLVYLHRLLSEHEQVRNRLSSLYEYILVDEYQDTNRIQADIVALLTGPEQNVMVVGDDAQSIYAFRGADYKNILEFPARYPGTTIIKLEENYRSLQPILDFTNALIEPAADKYSKCLFTRQGGGIQPVLVSMSGENAQSQYVVGEIARLRKQGMDLNQIAVLFRAGFHSFDLELELSRAALPFIKVGGFKFTESAHIKDALAHLKIFSAPRDRLSWYRVLLMIEKIGARTAERIYTGIMNSGAGAAGLLNPSLKLKKSAGMDRLKALVSEMDTVPHSVAQQGEIVLRYYLPLLKEKYDDYPRRLRDLEQLLGIMERYDQLSAFLSDMALEPPNTSSEDQLTEVSENDDQLVLSTIHSAKGLEWDAVFILYALEGRFPSYRSLDNPEALEEERRLMYVAATRARQRLYMTCPVQIYDRATQSMLYQPSRFIEDIPEDILDRRFFNPYASSEE